MCVIGTVAAVWNSANASSICIVEPGGRESLRMLGDLPITVRPRGITWTPDWSIVMFDVERKL